jgi:hypothetical protein
VRKQGKQESERAQTSLDLSHLRRETRTALELAIVALAPGDLLVRLAVVAGLLEAMVELPLDSPPVSALVPKVARRGKEALQRWGRWHAQHIASQKA